MVLLRPLNSTLISKVGVSHTMLTQKVTSLEKSTFLNIQNNDGFLAAARSYPV